MRRGRAAALSRLLAPWRWRVEPWGTGFVVHGPVGPLPPAGGVDDVVARAAAARPDVAAGLPAAWGDPLVGAAEAVVRASLVAWATGGAVIRGPGLHGHRRVLAHSDRPVDLVPDARGWRVAASRAQ